MSEKLKPCPCGSKNVGLFNDGDGAYWCQCRDCLNQSMATDNEDDAIYFWNRRADSKEGV